jgi:hypothetical protein
MNEYSPIVSEFGSEEEEQAYLVWLEAKVAKARADTRPRIPHDQVMAELDKIIAAKSKHEC